MPNIKSAKKRVKVATVRAAANKAYNSSLKTEIKKANIALAESSDDKDAKVKAAIKKIDMATSKGLLHKNTAARKKSALAKKLNKAQ